MAASRDRKQSQFLLELDKYYSERKKHSDSFADIPCPQNFIPGVPKAKADMKVVRTVSRKLSSICYRGIVVQVKDNMTAVEKGIIPGGLLAMAFPSPSQHTSCLEHKMEQILQRHSNFSCSLSTISEDHTIGEEIQKEESERLLENMNTRQRSCSLPTTRRDIGALPIISYDDRYIVAEFGNIIDHKRDRRSSYPLSNDDFEASVLQPMRSKKYDKFAFDSATRLGAFCRGMSYYGSTFDSSMVPQGRKKAREMPLQARERTNQLSAGGSSIDEEETMPNESIEESKPKSASKVETLEEEAVKVDTEDACLEQDAVKVGTKDVHLKEEAVRFATEDHREQSFRKMEYCSDPEEHIHSSKSKSSSSKFKSLKKRLTRKKNNENRNDSVIVRNTSKETLNQIQDVLRAKLPKTFQTTVKVGLSFDPVTVKERNDRGTKTPPRTIPVKNRSRSLTSSPQLLHRYGQPDNISNNSGVPSLVVSPPTGNGQVSGLDRGGLFMNFFRVGKDTLSRKMDRLSYKGKKDELISASSTSIEFYQSFSERRAKKLENLLGAEFGELYSKQRSNSLPLFRKKGVMMSKLSAYPRSTLDIGNDMGSSDFPSAFDMWSSFEASDSDGSYIQRSSGRSYESELSDCEQELENTEETSEIETEQKNVVPVRSVVILPRNGDKDTAIDQESMGGVDERIGEDGDPKHMPSGNEMVDMISIDTEKQSPTLERAQRTDRSSKRGSKFRVKTAYVLNKKTSLKSSKELMQESKGQHLESFSLDKKPRKRRQNRNHGIEKTKGAQICMVADSDNASMGKPPGGIQSSEEKVVVSSGEGERNGMGNDEFGIVTKTDKCVGAVCESELKELDALLTELEIYAMS